MAISTVAEWDVRTTGADTNGGGFDPAVASPGTDYSQQNSPQVTYTDLVIGATTTQLTSVAFPFTSAHVGNVINVTGGTGFTTGRYEVMSVSGGIATMDRSVGTAASSSGAGKLGGSFASIGAAIGAILQASAQTIHIKSGAYSTGATITWPDPGNGNSQAIQVRGYGTTHNDFGTRPVITMTASGLFNKIMGGGMCFDNIEFVNSNGTPGDGFEVYRTSELIFRRVKLTGGAIGVKGTYSIQFEISLLVMVDCEITGCSTSAVRNSAGGAFYGCFFHDNAGNAIDGDSVDKGFQYIIDDCIITKNAKGLVYPPSGVGTRSVMISNSTICFNTGAGVENLGSNFTLNSGVRVNIFTGNIIYGNGGYGLNLTSGSVSYGAIRNAFGANTSGDKSAGVTVTSAQDITLTANPFTNSAGNDFTLNNTAGGGALLRGNGWPSAFGSMTSYADLGPLTHQASAAGGLLRHPGMDGGMNG